MAALKKYFWGNDTDSDISWSDVRETNAKIGDQIFVEGQEVFQEGRGAPVEQASPLGYHVGWFEILFLNVSQMVGTGIFSTPGTLLKNLGSVGMSIMFWVFGAIIAAAGLAVFLEYAALFPNRSGGQAAYLEQAYIRPLFLFPAAYAFFTVAFSFSSSNAVVLARYIYRAAGYNASEWANKGLAVASYTFLAFLCLISTKWSLRIMNIISAVKLIILLFIVITGFAVLGGKTRVKNPRANFQNAFEGTTTDAYGIVNAFVKIAFAYQGYANGFNVVAEVKRPFHTIKIAAPVSLLIVSILYILAAVAYFAAVPKELIRTSGELTAALFFEAVFGEAGRALPALVAVSAAGNIMAVIIGATRTVRECGRQGLIPWAHFWVSTKPFGTPFAPIILKWALTTIVILALPFGDAFNFLIDLRSYPDAVFLFLLVVGLYLIRARRKTQGIPKAQYEAPHVALVISILINLYMLIAPWIPPKTGRFGGSVSFWYATYCVVGVGLLVACGLYYYVWIKLLPKWGKYGIRGETIVSASDGSVSNKLLRIPNTEIEEWDRTHDNAGNLLAEEIIGGTSSGTATANGAVTDGKFLKRVHVKSSRPLSAGPDSKV